MTIPQHRAARTMKITLIAATVLLLTVGARQSLGLFVLPVITTTGVSIVAMSLALAVGQFVWGAAQPIFGAIADKQGAFRVVVVGALLMASGSALTTQVNSPTGLLLTLGLLSAVGAAAGSFSIMIGAVSKWVPPERRSLAAGIINAGGSLGQFVFAPLMQFIISASGWVTAMLTLAASALLTIPLAWQLRCREENSSLASVATSVTLTQQLRTAARDPSYLYLHAGFFTCGFHIAFLVTHLPADLQLCGLPAKVAANSLGLIGLCNVAGSLAAGWWGQRYRMKNILAVIYASRAAMIGMYLWMPKTALNIYLFACGLGLTWLATVPPTSGLVGKLFGTRYLATLFGLTLLSHQIGGFLGAWLGGLALAKLGSYDSMWYADVALALAAALINLPIKETRPLAYPAEV